MLFGANWKTNSNRKKIHIIFSIGIASVEFDIFLCITDW